MNQISDRINHYTNHFIEPYDAKQKALTDEHIFPNIDELLAISHSFRNQLDEVILNTTNDHPWKSNFKNTINYPIGFCREFTIIFKSYLTDNQPKFLRDFVNRGGVFKVVWGMIKDSYFQTQLQIGGIFLDVANDTVNIEQSKVHYDLFHNTTFKNIKNYKDYIKIKENYHQSLIKRLEVPYLNRFFPLIDVNKPIILNKSVDTYLAEFGDRNDINNSPELTGELKDFIFKIIKDVPVEKIENLSKEEQFQRALRISKFINYSLRRFRR